MIDQTQSSVNLFHGPDAEEQAFSAAEDYGRILAVLGTEKGVRKDDSREMVRLHNMPPASDALGAVVVGPMDKATREASDALLKVVEEPSPWTRPFLWAGDIGDVPKTIRSRCHAVWAYGSRDSQTELPVKLLDEAVGGCGIAVAELLGKHTPKEVLDGVIQRMADTGIPPRNWALYKAVLGNETVSSVASVLVSR